MKFGTFAPANATRLFRRAQAGFTLIEANAATAMVGTFLAAILVMNSNLLGILKTSKETASASQALQERVEQMRIANWAQITNASYIRSSILNSPTRSSVGLPGIVETMTVSPYPNPSGMTPAQIVRTGTTAAIGSSNTSLVSQEMVRVDLKVVWQGSPDRRQRTRVTTALIAKGGITK